MALFAILTVETCNSFFKPLNNFDLYIIKYISGSVQRCFIYVILSPQHIPQKFRLY